MAAIQAPPSWYGHCPLSRDLAHHLSAPASPGAGPSAEVVEAVIDPGFTGYPTLPSETVSALLLPFPSATSAILPDGSTFAPAVHEAKVSWHGNERPVDILWPRKAAR